MDELVPITDAEGFVALYRRESPMLLTFCARRVLDGETALDLVAETFAQAFKGRRQFRGTTEVEARAWLLTIARRQIARYMEKGALDRKLVQKVGMQVPTMAPDEIAEVERLAGLPDLRALIGAELARLTADQREALRLRVVQELPYDEVAATLGVSEQTARARVSRGLRALNAALEGEGA
ncbi:RNA polymerase sigma factor [Conexibacter woesei]|uniref:RNA polymerase sigma factor n=1 Tax=Conexibacter woesei TaxID=191495 RepID=UPI0004197636|nr:RNA polymerase sigma factor [Conexibacter woesei]